MQNFECPKVVSLIPLVLARASQLQVEQRAGIVFACFALGGLHWTSVTAMISALQSEDREATVHLLKAFVQRTFGIDVGKWLPNSLECIETHHFKLLEHLKSIHLKRCYDVLQLSLCVSTSEISSFFEYATEFIKTPASKLIF